MPDTPYNYTISTATANGAVVSSKLEDEIQATSIVTALASVVTTGDILTITFRDALSSGDKTTLDGVVSAHDGVAPLTFDYVKQFVIQDPNEDKNLFVKGVYFTASNGTQTSHDVQFVEDIELQGVDCFARNFAETDYIEMFLVHPNPAVGVLVQFGETVYIPPTGAILPTPSSGTNLIPAGLIIRFVYTSTDSGGPQPSITCHIRCHR